MMRRTIRAVALSMLVATLTFSAVAITPLPVLSQDGGAITLYTDPGTGQVFTKRCKHCVRLGAYVPAESTREIERRVEIKTQQQLDEERAAMQAEEAQRQAQQQQWNAEMAAQVSEIKPWATEFGDRWYKKISVGSSWTPTCSGLVLGTTPSTNLPSTEPIWISSSLRMTTFPCVSLLICTRWLIPGPPARRSRPKVQLPALRAAATRWEPVPDGLKQTMGT